MRKLEDVPYLRGEFRRIDEATFGKAMENVFQMVDGVDEARAMAIVDAVIGPMLLISPPPGTDVNSECGHRYYHERRGWVFCTKNHGRKDDDPESHSNEESWLDWDSDMPEFFERAFAPAAKRSGR
jgi:hypothetical protein